MAQASYKPALLIDHSSSCRAVLEKFGLQLRCVEEQKDIPGSFWGDSEAGLIGKILLARMDTPLHSIFHEASHFICMDEKRRKKLNRDAGGDYDEENAVCYMQILLAAEIPAYGMEQTFSDMDAWGYSFRLGSSKRWFHEDAEDARESLLKWGLIDSSNQLSYRIRV